jgi:hypothetical protein
MQQQFYRPGFFERPTGIIKPAVAIAENNNPQG